MAAPVEMYVDWNTMDDTLPWTFVDDAQDQSRIVPGAFVVAGSGTAIAVAEVIDVGDDGVVHLRALPGPVARRTHLLDKAIAG